MYVLIIIYQDQDTIYYSSYSIPIYMQGPWNETVCLENKGEKREREREGDNKAY